MAELALHTDYDIVKCFLGFLNFDDFGGFLDDNQEGL